jgi:hypothetical protein
MGKKKKVRKKEKPLKKLFFKVTITLLLKVKVWPVI